jgi:hypothetical protein
VELVRLSVYIFAVHKTVVRSQGHKQVFWRE